MTLHPALPGTFMPAVNQMCSPTHHAFPSPPPTPNIIQQVPFMYPPFTQPPTTTFSPVSSPFPRSHYPWQQGNMNHPMPDYIPTTIWPACHPIEFSIPPPVSEPIPDLILDQKVVQSETIPVLTHVLPDDISSKLEGKDEATLVKETTDGTVEKLPLIDLDNEKVDAESDSCLERDEKASACAGVVEICNKESISEIPWEANERSVRILIRGRRNRKQTIRMPISLLKRPHYSQPFKAVCSRVVRGSETPNSIAVSSTGDSVA